MAPRRRRLRVAALAVLVVIGSIPLLGLGLVAWQSHDRLVAVEKAPTRDVVVFGAGLEFDGTPSPFLKARLQLALELYGSGRTTRIVVSGDGRTSNYNEPRAMKAWLVGQGVPAATIIEDPQGLDTYATCVRATTVYGVTQATLVTQSYHVGRAVTTCRLVGMDAVGVGDESVKIYTATWQRVVRREWPARVKMLWDLTTRPDVPQ